MNNIDIDFVIPWVNSQDTEWLEVYKKTFPSQAVDENRYRDMKLLKYWFRSIETHAPWVNRIFFITFGHIPDFLDVNHPKIKIIKHEDYIPSHFLPTFSSHVIELNLHRIHELSEHFVYFNDDTFIINDIDPDFFFESGLPKHLSILRPVVAPGYHHISSVQHNNNGLINENFDFKYQFSRNMKKWFHYSYGIYNFSNICFSLFNNFIGIHEDHMPTPVLKSTLKSIWNLNSEVLNSTCLNKTRNVKKDVNQWLIKSWQILNGDFYPQKRGCSKLINVESLESILEIKSVLDKKNIQMLCVNDHIKNWEEYEVILSEISKNFEIKYPKKSTYEI